MGYMEKAPGFRHQNCHNRIFIEKMTFSMKQTGTQCLTSVFQNLKSFFNSTTQSVRVRSNSGAVLAHLRPKGHHPGRAQGFTSGDLSGPWRFTPGLSQVPPQFMKTNVANSLGTFKSGKNMDFTLFSVMRHDFSHPPTSILSKKCIFGGSAAQTFFFTLALAGSPILTSE